MTENAKPQSLRPQLKASQSHCGHCSMAYWWQPSLSDLAASATWRLNLQLFKLHLFYLTFLSLISLCHPQTHNKKEEEEKQNTDALLLALLITTHRYTTYKLCIKHSGRVYNPSPHSGAQVQVHTSSKSIVVNSHPSQSCSYILGQGASSTLVGPKASDSWLITTASLFTVKLET